jgi:hypothetical protein
MAWVWVRGFDRLERGVVVCAELPSIPQDERDFYSVESGWDFDKLSPNGVGCGFASGASIPQCERGFCGRVGGARCVGWSK